MESKIDGLLPTQLELIIKSNDRDKILVEICNLLGVDKETYSLGNLKEAENNLTRAAAYNFIRAIKIVIETVDYRHQLIVYKKWYEILPELRPLIIDYVYVNPHQCLSLFQRIANDWVKLMGATGPYHIQFRLNLALLVNKLNRQLC